MTENTKDKLVAVVIVAVGIGTLLFAGHRIDTRNRQLQLAEVERKEVVCPSFLSIARSARDTLIVMRNEPLCNRYVLDNLK